MRPGSFFLILAMGVFPCVVFADIHIAPGRYFDYYHMRLVLAPSNTEVTVPTSERRHRHIRDNRFAFSEGGQFEVFISRSSFPIPVPRSGSDFLILRMPHTRATYPDASRYIEAKRRLFERIARMKSTGTGQIEVVVELNPYVRAVSKDPLRLELTEPNIFFRQAYGEYIDYTGPLRKPDQ